MITTDTHVYFYGGPAIYSNWFQCFFKDTITGIKFASTEQAFMWHKAIFFASSIIALEIEMIKDPRKVKELGRQIQNYNDKAWTCVRYGFMVYVNYLKYSQNLALSRELKRTGDRILVEASPYDKIWGVGVGIDNPDILDENKWQGQNLLGKALMEVREML